MNTNHTLRALRESRNLSLEEVAKEAKISFRTVLRAEQGYPLQPGSRQQLCAFFGKTSEELGLVPQRQRARSDAFAGNCFLKVGEPAKALERLTTINLELLADNRHASAFYDIASAHAAMGELDVTQTYAFRSINKALATDRLYIVPRCITLAQGIQERDPHEPHAAAILEYAHIALHENP